MKKCDKIHDTYVRQTQRMDCQRKYLLKTENRSQKVRINKTTGEKRAVSKGCSDVSMTTPTTWGPLWMIPDGLREEESIRFRGDQKTTAVTRIPS